MYSLKKHTHFSLTFVNHFQCHIIVLYCFHFILFVFLFIYLYLLNNDKNFSMHDQSDSRSLSDSLDNIPSNVFGPEGLVTRFTLPLSYGRKEARQKRVG